MNESKWDDAPLLQPKKRSFLSNAGRSLKLMLRCLHDLHAIEGTPNVFQVDNYPHDPPSECRLKTHHVACSCDGCASESTCHLFSMRQSTANMLRLKVSL